jgi:hypothetical protein
MWVMKWYVTCALMEKSTKLVSHCDAIVRVGAQMLDLFTFPALLVMQQPKVRHGMVVMI